MAGQLTPRGLATDIVVGEDLTLCATVGGADLTFGLRAKHPALSNSLRAVVDKVQITLTIENKHGQRARVRVQAPDSVRIRKPEKAAA